MAGEIFVGSVAVGVVPDLTGFNDKIRAEVVPGADDIGAEIGREISRGITDNLDIGAIIVESSGTGFAAIRAAAFELGTAYGISFKKGIELQLEDPVKAKVELDSTELAIAHVELDELSKDRTVKFKVDVEDGISGIAKKITGGGGRSSSSRSSTSSVGPLGQVLQGQQLFGLFQGVQELPPQAQAAIAATVAAGLPFAGQALAGGIVGGLGTGLAGLGILGSLGLKGQTTTATGTADQGKISAAQERLIADQDALNKLRDSGKTTAQQLASAEATLQGAQSSAAAASAKYAADQKAGLTSQQETVRQSFSQIATNAESDLAKIGVSFVPVMLSISSTVESVMGKITPIFADAEKIIAGPFKVFADTLINSFADPQVTSSISAVASSFGDILKAMTPDIAGITDSFADAIERIANAVAKNPKAAADFLNFLFQIPIAILDAIAFLTDAADYIEGHFTNAVNDFAHFWIKIWNDINRMATTNWDAMWNDIMNKFWNVTDVLHDTWSNTVNFITSASYTALAPVRFLLDQFLGWWRQNAVAVEDIWSSFWMDMSWIVRQIWGSIVKDVQIEMGLLVGFIKFEVVIIKAIWGPLWAFMEQVTQATFGIIVALVAYGVSTTEITFRVGADIIKGLWEGLWAVLTAEVKVSWAIIELIVKNAWDIIVGIITVGLDLVTFQWGKAWDDVKTVAEQIWNNLRQFFNDSSSWLYQAGVGIIHGLLSGMGDAMKDMAGWLKANVVDPIIDAIKRWFGISSPATSTIPIGQGLIAGVLKGMISSAGNLTSFMDKIFGGWPQALGSLVTKGLVDVAKLPEKALNAIGGLAGKVGGALGGFFSKMFGGAGGSGVQRWAGTVAQALAMLGLPLSLGPQVLYQMQTESGGNPNAINLTDINAQMGDPSRGLLQTIGSTFAMYHVAGTSNNIYDPLANIAAAINYARATYGPSLMRGGMGMGSGHGYDTGGYLPPGYGVWSNMTGKPEPVLTDSQWNALYSGASGGSSGPTYIAHFDGLTGQAIEGHVRTAFHAMSLTQGNLNRQGRRS